MGEARQEAYKGAADEGGGWVGLKEVEGGEGGATSGEGEGAEVRTRASQAPKDNDVRARGAKYTKNLA